MLRRFALISDIHANLPALDAVLADIGALGVSERYCLGDLVGYGPHPAEVIDRIRSLGVPTVRGNYDDGIGFRRGECGCYYPSDRAEALGRDSYAFTAGALDDADADWLAALPDDIRLEERDLRVLLAHGSPRRINEYLLPDRADRQLARLAREAGVDVVCVGHVHVPYHRAMTAEDGARVHYVSSGSVGKPKDGDPRAGWVEVVIGDADDVALVAPHDDAAGAAGSGDTWVAAATHRVTYDVDAVAADMLAAGLPPELAEALRTA